MIALSRIAPLVLAAALALPWAAGAQQVAPASRVLGVAIGLAEFHQRDEYLSPVTFRGAIPSVSALLEKRSRRTLRVLELSVGAGRTNSPVLPRDVHQYVGRLSFALLRALAPGNADGRGLAVLAGGGLSSFASITDLYATDATWNYTYRDWSYYWSHSLDLALRAELSASRRSVALRVTAPAVRLVARPNNGKDYNTDNAWVSRAWPRALTRGTLEPLWDHPAVFGEAEYRQRVGGRLQLRASYDFTYASSDRPLPLGMYVNRFLVGFVRPI